MALPRLLSATNRSFSRSKRYPLRFLAPALLTGLLVTVGPSASAAPGNPQYPELRTLPPSDLMFDTVLIDGVARPVLRFSNTVWNAGSGPLHLVAKSDRQSGKSQVFQRIYSNSTASGRYDQRHVGEFVFHPAHDHFHFENFAEYQLWPAAEWNQWVSDGRPNGAEHAFLRGQGTKTTFCIMDTWRVDASRPGSPASAGYAACGRTTQGMSVGWGDTYSWQLPDQWVVLGSTGLADGLYVLRSIADPLNVLYESANRANSTVESRTANEALTTFRVVGGSIEILSP
jgi:Lysyl oxidase